MAHILWLSSIVLPDYAQEFGIRRSNREGWIDGMLAEMDRKDYEIDLCFPIYDRFRMKNGKCNGHTYYTFHCKSIEAYDEEMIEELEQILELSKPDLVHIWGVEFSFAAAMIHACQRQGLLERVVANIQGLTSNIVRHFYADIPEEYRTMQCINAKTIEQDYAAFECRAECEVEAIRMLHHIIGRTDWDYAIVLAINLDIHYYSCDEIMRSVFYENVGRWEYGKCQKYRIFLSQAGYSVKGFHYLLQALPLVLKKYPDTHVHVAGENIIDAEEKIPYACYLNELLDTNNLREHVTFIGNQDAEHMVTQYLQANVFVSASSIENSCNSLNEAMLIGVPSVASYVGGTNNRLTTEIEGFLYPHDEPALLAFYICKIFQNKNNLCDNLSANAVKKMSRLVDREINTEKMLEIYQKIIDRAQEEMQENEAKKNKGCDNNYD